MNHAIIFRLLALILVVVAAAFGASLLVGIFSPVGVREAEATRGFHVGIAACLVLAAVFAWSGRRGSIKIFRKEALALVGISWLLVSCVGAIPYVFVVPEVGLMGAFFESASGFTTTGASVLANLEELPHGLLFWRSLSQWIGGLGVVVFFVAVLSFLGSGAKVLFSREYSGHSDDVFDGKMQTGALRIMFLYLGLSGLCFLAFMLCGLDWFEAACHMFSTMSTGGFSTRSASVAAFQNPAFEWATIFFMTISGVSFLLMLRLLRGQFGIVRQNMELTVYLFILAAATGLVATFVLLGGHAENFHDLWRDSLFQVVSIQTTTGFVTENYVLWPYPVHVVLIALMFIGGCSGSTSGGMKVARIAVAARVILNQLERAIRPNVMRPIRVSGRNLTLEARDDILVFIALTLLIFGASSIALSVLEPGLDPTSLFSAVTACLFNIGPGLGAVGPIENYAAFSQHSLFLLGLLMIMGRLEFFAILILFLPSLWKRFS